MKIIAVLFLCILVSLVSARSNRIIGGTATTTTKYPYQVAIVESNGSGGFSSFCGGSILNANYILSAAHCFRELQGSNNVDRPVSGLFVASTTQISGIQSNKRFAIQQVFIHPGYSATVAVPDQVDICVVRVSTITFDSTTLPVVLARPQDRSLFPPGTTAFATGFGLIDGRLNTNVPPPNQMQEVSIPIVTPQACNNALSASGISVNYPVVCAGADGRDTCQGDSGGPLTIVTQNTYLQVGVVVFGTVNAQNPTQCGAPGNFGVYASVADYRSSFIEPITGALPVLGDSGVATNNNTGGTTGDGTTNSSNSFHSLSPLFLLFSLFFIFAINFF